MDAGTTVSVVSFLTKTSVSKADIRLYKMIEDFRWSEVLQILGCAENLWIAWVL